MRIINNTNLNYMQIGFLIDKVISSSAGDTIYYGKEEWLKVEYSGKTYDIVIRYLKRYVEWRFDYYDK